MANNIKTSTIFGRILHGTSQIQRHHHLPRSSRNIGTPAFPGRLRNRSYRHRNHRIFQPVHRYGNLPGHHTAQSADKRRTVGYFFIHRMDRNCYQPAFLRRLMADCRLLRQPDLAHPVPTSVRQPLLCLRHHRARSHVLSQQRIQIHRCPQFHYPDSRRCGSGYGSPLRSRTLRTDYHPDHLQHTDICSFPTSAIRNDCVSHGD